MVEKRSKLAVGVTFFAAVMLIIIGVLHAMEGLVALVNDTFYVVGEKWTFTFSLGAWGWIHLLVGVVVAITGVFVLYGAVWARTVGVLVAAVSALVSFAWLPYYPVWGVVVIALDVAVIWALTLHGHELKGDPYPL